MVAPSIPKFHYDPEHDTNDSKKWSEMDLEDLRNTLARGGSIEFSCAVAALRTMSG